MLTRYLWSAAVGVALGVQMARTLVHGRRGD
jgi:hypothetical protein